LQAVLRQVVTVKKDLRGPRSQLVMAELLQGSLEAAKELGVDLSPILEELGIAPQSLAAPEGFLQVSQVTDFLESVAERFDCPHFGFLVGTHQPPFRFGPARQLLRLSPNLHQAILNIREYIEIYSDTSRHELAVNGGFATIIRFDRYPGAENSIQLHTLGIVQVVKAMKEFCGTSWQASSIHFRHAKPPQVRQYARYMKCPVYFDSEYDCIVFPERFLYQPNEASDPELYAMVQAHCEGLLRERREVTDADLTSQVKHYIRQYTGTRQCNLQACADQLGAHPRTLQRELAGAATNFKQLLLEERMQLAREYMQHSNISLTDLAELLGYGSVSNFSRAFSAVHHSSPRGWRQQAQGCTQ
jgi:AraC-like DNA-binding protein